MLSLLLSNNKASCHGCGVISIFTSCTEMRKGDEEQSKLNWYQEFDCICNYFLVATLLVNIILITDIIVHISSIFHQYFLTELFLSMQTKHC